MTSQLRGASGYQPTQSQPIPNRFTQPRFGAGQAYSPRHMQSSPLQHQPYYSQQPGISAPPHEMYNAGPGITGTSPAQAMMMPPQPYYHANGHRPRGPSMHPMPNPPRSQIYYQPMMQRFQNMPPTSTSAAFYSSGQSSAQFPYLSPAQQIQFSQGYSPQFVHPPNQPPITPMQQAVQQTSVEKKRERRPVRIVDPSTNMDVTDDIINHSHRLDSFTPPLDSSSVTPTNEIASKFAAQVADVARTDKVQEKQTGGPPTLNSQVCPPNPLHANVPPSSSPRPQAAQQTPQAPVANLDQMQQGEMSVVSPAQEQMQPAAGYQLTSQLQQVHQAVASPMQIQGILSTVTHIPEHVQTYCSQPTNISNSTPSMTSQHAQNRTVRSQPRTTQHQSQPIVQRQILSRPSAKKDAGDSSSNKDETFVNAATPSVVEASEQNKTEALKIDAASNGIVTTNPSTLTSFQLAQPDAKEDVARKAPSISLEPATPITLVSNTLSKTGPEKESQTMVADQSYLTPGDHHEMPEKEDTAIRLDGKFKINGTEPEATEPAAKEECLTQDAQDDAPVESPSCKNINLSTNDLKSEETELVTESVSNPEAQKPIAWEPERIEHASLQPEEKVAPVPSGKAAAGKTDLAPGATSVDGEKFTISIDKIPRVKSPEPQQNATDSDFSQSKSSKKDSTSVDGQKQLEVQAAKQMPQKQVKRPVANGMLSDEQIESGGADKGAKKAKNMLPSTKIDKATENISPVAAADRKPKEASRSRSVSSENAFEKLADKRNGVTPTKSNPAPHEIKYDNDQWTPENPEGKRQYGSNFLLQFQYRQTSLEKPKDLPNIDIVLDQPHKQIAAPMQPMELRTDFIPNYMRGSGPRRGPGRQNSRDHRPSGRSSMSGPSGLRKVVSIDRDVELKTTANAWKPTKHDSKISSEEQETMGIIRDVRAVLNKLTPSTFKELMTQVLSLKIDTEKKLRGTIDLIFEKAIDEPNFSEAYANMCRHMTSIQVTPESVPGTDLPPPEQNVEFRKLLLTRCQREFEKNKSDQEHLHELKKKMEENTDLDIAPQLKEEYEFAEAKERRRTLGNIRFIGELFKLRMLTEGIMHNCIISLFKARDDDHLESLCRLLSTIGKDLDHQKGKQRMDQIFDQIMKIIQEKRTSARVRFMLQDVHDLRLNNWVPRAIQTQGPKTISQIHQDAKNEEQLLQMKLATTPVAQPQRQQGGRQQGRMGSRGHGEDGWTKVAQAPKSTRYDPNKMKLKPNAFDGTNVMLAPSREFGKWKSGSAGSSLTRTGLSGYSQSGSMDRTPETGRSNTPTNMMNRFSALSQGSQGQDYEYQRRQGGRHSSRERSMDRTPETGRSNTPTNMMNRFSALSQGAQGQDYDYQRRPGGRQSSYERSRTGSRGSMGPPSLSGPGGRYPRRDERSQLLETARQITSADKGVDLRLRASPLSSPRSSRETSPSVTPRRPSTPRQQPVAHQYRTDLDDAKMQNKSKSILEEFLSIVDFKEATECIEELNAPPSLLHSFVFVAHEFTLEKKKEERMNIGRLMAHLLKRGRLSLEQYMKGLVELLEMATDYEIDVPKVWECLAEQLVPVFEDEARSDVPLACLAELAAPLQEENKSGVFVAEVVKAIIRRGTLESFISRWQRSHLLWSKIVGKDCKTVELLLREHNLQQLSDSEGLPRQVQSAGHLSQLSPADEQYRLEQNISKLLEVDASNEDIFVWVEKSVKEEDRTKSPFLRALTISICKGSMNTMAVDGEKITERSIVLKKYIDTNPERELQALYALQHLMVILEQPANVLRKFFDVLYHADVVSEQTFYKWEKSDDPNEQEGRGVAVASVNPFFTWLRTAEPESD